MTLRRLALLGIVLTASIVVASGPSPAATAKVVAPAGLPLYQFAETGTGPLPWNAKSLEGQLQSTKMLGGPHGATNATEGVLAYRTSQSQLALFTQSAAGSATWLNLTAQNNVPNPAADPIPFFDPSGNVDLLYVDSLGHVILLSPNDPDTSTWRELHRGAPWRPYVTTDLSALTGVLAANGLPSVVVEGLGATVAYRTAADAIEVLTLTWNVAQPIPIFSLRATTVTNVNAPPVGTTTTTTTTTSSTTSTTTTSTTTTTTLPLASATAFASDPVVLPGLIPAFATTLNNGSVVVFSNTGAAMTGWTTQNLTTQLATTPVTGALSIGTSPSVIDVAALTATGSVELFTTTYLTPTPTVSARRLASNPESWSEESLSTLASGAPPLSGALAVEVTNTQVAVAGQAANWGDLFVLTNAQGTVTWSATDVSVTAGSAARTVGGVVAGLSLNGQLTLYAAGVSAPPPQGVGVYAIPSAKWTKAITDGWPIISTTGGLGTQSAPWVGFTSTTNVADSPDFLLGQSIYNTHKRVTWLSFWTVSGPLANQAQTTTNYYNHGFAAGVWVATQIDQYRGLGVGLKPDWVILDPEGYPDNHSRLDAPGGSSAATLAKYATYWSSMMKGWQVGLNSVDPTLNAGLYASQSEYRNYQLSTLPLPVFMAVAFSGGGPIPIAGASGSNVRGFISFGAVCTPATKLAAEAATLMNPPWGGAFNTLQFNAGVYCAPPPS